MASWQIKKTEFEPYITHFETPGIVIDANNPSTGTAEKERFPQAHCSASLTQLVNPRSVTGLVSK